MSRVKLAEAEPTKAERNVLWDIELKPTWPLIEKVAAAQQDSHMGTAAWIKGLLDA